MISLLIAAAVALAVSIFGTPYAIRMLRRRQIGQFIQDDIQTQHAHKQGTPTMGGVVFVVAAVVGYLVSHVRVWTPDPPRSSAETSSPVAAFTSGGPPRKIVPVPRTMTVSSLIAGTYAPPAVEEPITRAI